MAAIEWSFGDKDPGALSTLEQRIAETGRSLGLITYSELVADVVFHLPNVRNGEAFKINTHQWTGLDRAVLGDFLGYISTRSYQNAGFMASALVVNGKDYRPSDHFFEFMRWLEVLPDTLDSTISRFWIDQVNKAHNWYRSGRRRR
jgi:hypothetical protein